MSQISASVGEGGRNIESDVRTVQRLLNDKRSTFGQTLIAVDGLVGPETIGAIRDFQSRNFGWADGRVDPNGPTLAALNTPDAEATGRVRCQANDLSGGSFIPAMSVTKSSLVSSPTAGEAPPPVAATPKDTALLHKTETLQWIESALTAIQNCHNLMVTGLTEDAKKLDALMEFQALKTHFHIDKSNNPMQMLSTLGKLYSFMKIAVNGADTNFENDFVADDFANSDPGGFHTRSAAKNPGRMYFCQKYLAVGKLTRVVTIIHEAAHYVDKTIDHFASAVPFPTGRALTGTNGVTHTNNYQNLTPDEALQNAASFACFAIHCAKKADTRPTITQ